MIFNMTGGGGGTDRGAGGGLISTVDQKILIPEGLYNGEGFVSISPEEQAKIIESNIAAGVTLLGKTGTFSGRFASGTTTTAGYNKTVTISGLSFRPKIILISAYCIDSDKTYNYFQSLYVNTIDSVALLSYIGTDGTLYQRTSGNDHFSWTIKDDGFDLVLGSKGNFYPTSKQKPWVCIG